VREERGEISRRGREVFLLLLLLEYGAAMPLRWFQCKAVVYFSLIY